MQLMHTHSIKIMMIYGDVKIITIYNKELWFTIVITIISIVDVYINQSINQSLLRCTVPNG